MRAPSSLGAGWQYDPAEPDVGHHRDVIYHQGADDCDIADEEWGTDHVRVECTCGEIYLSEKAEP